MLITPLKTKHLPLKNNGTLQIFFLGTGSAFSKRFNQTNFLIIKGDTHLLVDCGATASKKLGYFNRTLVDIENYHITHSHADHIGGLEEAMLSHRYLSPKQGVKPKIIITKEYQDILWDQSLKGGNAYSEVYNNKPLCFEDFWELIYMKKMSGFERETWTCQFENLNLKMPRTCHFPSNTFSWKQSAWSTGLIIDERIFLTSDTKYDLNLITEYNKLYDIEVIFHDCQLFNGGIHASLDELKQLSKDIRQKTILMHYGDNIFDYMDDIKKADFHSIAMTDAIYTF